MFRWIGKKLGLDAGKLEDHIPGASAQENALNALAERYVSDPTGRRELAMNRLTAVMNRDDSPRLAGRANVDAMISAGARGGLGYSLEDPMEVARIRGANMSTAVGQEQFDTLEDQSKLAETVSNRSEPLLKFLGDEAAIQTGHGISSKKMSDTRKNQNIDLGFRVAEGLSNMAGAYLGNLQTNAMDTEVKEMMGAKGMPFKTLEATESFMGIPTKYGFKSDWSQVPQYGYNNVDGMKRSVQQIESKDIFNRRRKSFPYGKGGF